MTWFLRRGETEILLCRKELTLIDSPARPGHIDISIEELFDMVRFDALFKLIFL
jgi:hypothetical protein